MNTALPAYEKADPIGSISVETASPAINSTGRTVREAKGFSIVANPNTGALSALKDLEFMAFERLERPNGVQEAIALYKTLGHDQARAERSVKYLLDRLEHDGWMRTGLPISKKKPFGAVYLTITRECNLACPYCYQGLSKRNSKIMPMENIVTLLDNISAKNDEAHIIVTGGEPMMHPNFFGVLDEIAKRGLTMSILTNGNFIDDEAAEKFKSYPGIERIQISIDGLTEETYALSRGRKSFTKTVNAIGRVARHGLPFLLAPTIHDENAHEILDMARWAIELGGSISANDLRHLPHDSNPNLKLSEENLRKVRTELGMFLAQTAREHPDIGARMTRLSTRSCSQDPINARFICGVAYSLIDIDWNGDVYPCHMLKGDELKIGNAFEQDFDEIFATGVEKGWRTKSHEIDGCSSCSFMSTCASGCRAKTYYAYGTPEHRSPSCSDNGRHQTQKLLMARGVKF